VEAWARAWPIGDVDGVVARYADGAVFHSHPFRASMAPREYVEWAFSEQVSAECRFGTPIVDGRRAAIDWWAVVTAANGSIETLAGISMLRFSDDGLVVEQRDAWAAVPGRLNLSCWAIADGPPTIRGS
jgi:SnoaL-like domain